MRRTTRHPLALVLAGALLASVTACGGSDDDEDMTPPPPPPPTQPTPVTLQGSVMINQGIQNAVVCMDLNANSVCDGNEPASAPTNANGAYSLTYDSSQISPAQVATASLIAPITTSSTDAAEPGQSATAQPYVLRQVPGKSGQINPLTTLVAKGMADGMTEGAARINAAVQLGIAEAKIDNYQDDPAIDPPQQVQDSARTLAAFIASALEHGKVLQVGDPTVGSGAVADVLTRLSYEDAANYGTTVIAEQARAAGSAERTYTQPVTKVAAGVPVTDVRSLYPALYLTPTGWKRCDNTTVHSATLDSPNLSIYCDTQKAISYQLTSDIGGQPMAQVINALQADPASNPINRDIPTSGLLTAVGTATFPAGAQLLKSTRLLLAPPMFISNTGNQFIPQAQAKTLEELVAAKQAAGVNLATTAGSLSLGAGTSLGHNLRVAFTGTTSATDGTVQYYDCDLSPTDVASNCSATNTGTYHINTVGGVRVMRFDGYAPTTASSENNFYAEVKNTSSGDYVYRVRQAKTVAMATTSYRLNGTAWAALKAQLGL